MSKYTEMRASIETYKQQIKILEDQIREMHDACRAKASAHVLEQVGFDCSGLVEGNCWLKDSFDNNSLRKMLFGKNNYDYSKEEWQAAVKKLVDADLIIITSWFYTENDVFQDTELDDSYLNPEDGVYADPHLGVEITKEEFFEQVYETYRVSNKFFNLVQPFFAEFTDVN